MSSGVTRRQGPRALASNLVEKMQRAWGESPFYQAQLKGPAPDRFVHRPRDPYTLDESLGTAIAEGRFSAGAEAIDCEGELGDAWSLAARGSLLHEFLHRFAWLRPLAALGEKGRGPAQQLAVAWLVENEDWAPESWEPFVTGERLVALCCHGDLVLGRGDALWRSRVLSSMARQTRHLAHSGHRARNAYERLMAATSLTIAGLCLPGCDNAVERGLELLRRELRIQVRADGGHVSRNPSRQLKIVIRLKMVVDALEARGVGMPGFLKHMIGRSQAFMALFRLGDGRLAVFNGGYEDDGRALVAALDGANDSEELVGFARYSGFQRLDAAKSVVIADVGAAQASAGKNGGGSVAAKHGSASRPATGYLSDGSFNFASGRARMIVNCGAGLHLPGEWALALRQAGAHSTLSSEPIDVMAQAAQGAILSHRRGEDDDGHLVEIERRLTAISAQATHTRRLYLTKDGGDLRGQDALSAPSPALAAHWRLRFHLHPSVKASLSRDRRTVILALSNGEGWRFRTNCKRLSLEKTVYCGAGELPQWSEQIVLSSDGLEHAVPGDMLIKWGFKRMGAD